MRGKLLYLDQQDFPSSDVCGKPLIQQGRIISGKEICQGSDILETRGDILIRGLWERWADAIIDVKLGDADAETYRFELMVVLLDW